MLVLTEVLSVWYGAGSDLGAQHVGTRNVRSDGCTSHMIIQRTDTTHWSTQSNVNNIKNMMFGGNWKKNKE